MGMGLVTELDLYSSCMYCIVCLGCVVPYACGCMYTFDVWKLQFRLPVVIDY